MPPSGLNSKPALQVPTLATRIWIWWSSVSNKAWSRNFRRSLARWAWRVRAPAPARRVSLSVTGANDESGAEQCSGGA